MPAERKVKLGISFEPELVKALDKAVSVLTEFGVDRSEAVNAVLSEFFEGGTSTEAVWEVVTKMRARKRR